MSPSITLYRANGSCSLVPHALLQHFSIPFRAVLMESTPSPSALATPKASFYRAADGSLSHEEYLQINPTGYVPCLVVDSDPTTTNTTNNNDTKTVITEMPAILTYISSLIPSNNHILGQTPLQRAKVTEWTTWLSGTLHGSGFGALWRPARYSNDEEAHASISAKGRENIEKCYARIDERLAGREYAVGEGLTVVDFNVWVFWRWGGIIGVDMPAKYPNYDKFAKRVAVLEGVKKALEVEGNVL
ncbi:glutathione s-transferase [Colletotrichum plurivorum]|uniref:Glutathione s-transferase n=1 Tax=Colletotrichum plurivorum TaxID=2175906 RepID=A0A8H6NAN3_9PEZI|nr:glutathione s-transferase [Colletotrichum plurivorum]